MQEPRIIIRENLGLETRSLDQRRDATLHSEFWCLKRLVRATDASLQYTVRTNSLGYPSAISTIWRTAIYSRKVDDVDNVDTLASEKWESIKGALGK